MRTFVSSDLFVKSLTLLLIAESHHACIYEMRSGQGQTYGQQQFGSGASQPAPQPVVYGQPTQPSTERPPAPSPTAVWIDTYSHWTGSAWTVITGHWDEPPPGTVWQPSTYTNGQYYPGFWRPLNQQGSTSVVTTQPSTVAGSNTAISIVAANGTTPSGLALTGPRIEFETTVGSDPNVTVGQYFDSSFRRLGASAIPAGQEASIQERPFTEQGINVVQIADERQWQASIGFWILSASTSASQRSQHWFYRAFKSTSIRQLPDAMSLNLAPPGAVWYISSVKYGRMIEADLAATSSAQGNSLQAAWQQYEGSIGNFGQQFGLTAQTRCLGYVCPANPMLARSEDELRGAYTENGTPVPIFLRFTRIAAANVMGVANTQPLIVTLEEVEFPQGNWDPMSGPEIGVMAQQDGRQFFSDETCPSDRRLCQPRLVISRALTASPARPVRFYFYERDALQNDPAGSYDVTDLPLPGRSRDYSAPNGVRIKLHAELPSD